MPLMLRVATWLALAAITAGVWRVSDRAVRRWEIPTPVIVRQDVVYRSVDGQRLSLDVYLPPGDLMADRAGPGRPAILAIHGGSWIGGSKRLFRPSPWNPHPTAVRLAESGYVVIAADYRLARPGAPGWPAALDDLREAVPLDPPPGARAGRRSQSHRGPRPIRRRPSRHAPGDVSRR